MSVVQEMAKEFYALRLDEVQTRLNVLPKWPATRTITRVLSIREAVRRLKSREIAELVWIGFVGVVEVDNKLYPVRIMDVMLGYSTDEIVKQAKIDLEFERSIRGDRASLDVGSVWRGRN